VSRSASGGGLDDRRSQSGRSVTPGALLPLCLLAALVLCLCRSLDAADAEPLEYRVKAAFLLNFTKFIEWPPSSFSSADSPFDLCVMGEDPFGRALDELVEGETVNGRKLEVQRIRRDEAKNCQVLFIDNSEKEIPKILSGLGPGVLTVGEGDGFLRDGGIIGFVIQNRRVRFDINQSAAEAARLKISSKLLIVARNVR